MRQILFSLSMFFVCAAVPASDAKAQVYDIEGVAVLDILHGYRTADGRHMAAARFRLAEGWKTYWRQPGGTGIPPRFTFAGTRNVAGVSFHWPQPTVFDDQGDRVLGYERELILPIELKPTNSADEIRLKGQVEFGLCDDICIPAQAKFNVVLPATGTVHRPLIEAALLRRPKAPRAAQAHCQFRPTADGFRIAAELRLPERLGQGAFVVMDYLAHDVWVDLETVARADRGMTLDAALYNFADGPLMLDRSKFTFAIFDNGKMMELSGCRTR